MVNWFFLRLETNYGTKYWTQFSDEKTVQLTKREWARNILRYSREELHTAIEQAKQQRELGNPDFDWPDIAKILGLLKNQISPDGRNSTAYIDFKDPRHPDYQPPRIENLTQRQRREKLAKDSLANLKAMF